MRCEESWEHHFSKQVAEIEESNKQMKVVIESGKRYVSIRRGKYSIEFTTMINGFQKTGMPVDIELLQMMQTAINNFLDKEDV